MRRKSYVITAALIAGLALGIIFSPGIGSSTASAQTQPPAPTQTASPFDSLWTLFLDKLAAALNIQRSALDSAITSAGNGAVDEAVAQGTLSQAQADELKARLAAGDVGALWSGRGGRGGPRVAGLREAMMAAAAQRLNITADELETQLRSGQTLAQLAQANNTSEQAVIDAALAAARTKLAEAVTAGTLTQAQADAKYAQPQAAGADILRHGGRGRHRDALPGAPAAPEATPTTEADA